MNTMPCFHSSTSLRIENDLLWVWICGFWVANLVGQVPLKRWLLILLLYKWRFMLSLTIKANFITEFKQQACDNWFIYSLVPPLLNSFSPFSMHPFITITPLDTIYWNAIRATVIFSLFCEKLGIDFRWG